MKTDSRGLWEKEKKRQQRLTYSCFTALPFSDTSLSISHKLPFGTFNTEDTNIPFGDDGVSAYCEYFKVDKSQNTHFRSYYALLHIKECFICISYYIILCIYYGGVVFLYIYTQLYSILILCEAWLK